MKFMSESFKGSVSVIEEDCSDMFALLSKSLGKVKESDDLPPFSTSLALRSIGNTSISLENFKNATMSDLEGALNTLQDLKEFMEGLDTEPEHTPLDKVPEELRKFFTVTKNIGIYKHLVSCKPDTRRRKVTKSKAKMFF